MGFLFCHVQKRHEKTRPGEEVTVSSKKGFLKDPEKPLERAERLTRAVRDEVQGDREVASQL